MKRPLAIAIAVALGACATPQRPSELDNAVAEELNAAARAPVKPRPDRRIEQALMPPLSIELPRIDGRALEPRFDLSVRQAPATQVFMSIVQGTRYSMLLHPDVEGTITVSLKDVTVKEALESIRELYGYEFRVEGTRIFVQSVAMQTRVFQVNYLIGQRQGRTDIQVNSGIAGSPSGGGGAAAGGGGGAAPSAASSSSGGGGASGGGGSGSSTGSSTLGSRPGTSTQVATLTRNDFWADLQETLKAIVNVTASSAPSAAVPTGSGAASSTSAPSPSGALTNRSVVVNAQAGVVVVRAMPAEIRAVEQYLKAVRSAIERQVMLEAKIVEVTLGDGFQSGINWAVFHSNRVGAGLTNPFTELSTSNALSSGAITSNLNNRTLSTNTAAGVTSGLFGANSLFSLAVQTANFASLLQFLETQGSVQVLSSPRIAAINNQKAVLKVGTEEYFVTNVSGGTSAASGTTTTATTTLPSLTIQPFFSGVALDVLPQIDDDGAVILHIRPTVSNVEQDNRAITLGSQFGTINLPLAKSTASETDSIVRVQDGNIVAIGGLMKIDVIDNRSGLPGTSESPISGVLNNRRRQVIKKELVVLIRPTVVRTESEMNDDARRTIQRVNEMMGRSGFVNTPSRREQ